MTSMQPKWAEDKDRLHDQLDELWRAVEAFAASGTAVHEVERHLFRELLRLGWSLLRYFFEHLGPGDQGPRVALTDGRTLKRLDGLSGYGPTDRCLGTLH